MRSADIRQQFIRFFEDRGHRFVPSSPVVPHDDPTLMFANAGMNQFKDVFLGTGRRDYARAANSQKCIRVSGKHNDLEQVGRDTYHHTFFEMLGNWSFGDYFKAEAIEWAWELLTGVWGLPGERLYATVFGGDASDGLEPDEDAERFWQELTPIGADHVRRFGRKDNFWEMGETGPCGPCSEIHIDLGPERCDRRGQPGHACGVNGGCARFIELWNLVFIQFNRDAEGGLHELPAKHVDTGMGFERLVALLQDKKSNYDTDVFAPLIERIVELTGQRYSGQLNSDVDDAFRVVADHARMLTFSITDGALPSNEGRGYVLRRLLRRAAMFGRLHLRQRQPFIHRLVATIADSMGGAFPELTGSASRVAEVIRDEELSFGRTLDRGIVEYETAKKWAIAEAKDIAKVEGRTRPKACIDGRRIWNLYQTYGFPADLTRLMAERDGLDCDMEGFEAEREKAREKARAEHKAKAEAVLTFHGTLPDTDDSPKYAGWLAQARVLGWVRGNRLVAKGRLEGGEEVGLVLDRTCFYSEQGGQVGDAGEIVSPTGTYDVDDTRRLGEGVLHLGHVGDGYLEVGQEVQLSVDPRRDDTRRNHTATHLVHWALREVLGEHVTQRGSLVDPLRLRFDFDHPKPLTAEEIELLERKVNERIYADLPVRTQVLDTAEARKLPGVRAFFGEKYGERVRVVEIGDGFSREFCGGTHLARTGQAGFFKIVSEESVAKGVRRITAVTGPGAVEYVQRTHQRLRFAASLLRVPDDEVGVRLEAIVEELKKLRQGVGRGMTPDLKSKRDELLRSAEKVNDVTVVVGELPTAPVPQLRECIDWFRDQAAPAAVFIAARQNDQVTLLAGVTHHLMEYGVSANLWVKHVAPLVGGSGGGKADLAQAGGKNPAGVTSALDEARKWIRDRLVR